MRQVKKLSNLEQAISLATKAHFGQVDKAGNPYILHPLRLMFKLKHEDEMIVAVMHDIIEDSDYTFDDLKDYGFSDKIIKAIQLLTKPREENYEAFISRILENNLARKVKIEDIKDNLDLTRLNTITDKDLLRIKKYHHALKKLKELEVKSILQ